MIALVENWRGIAFKAWSMRLWALGTVLGFMEQLLPALPYLDGVLPPKTLAVLSIVCGAAGLVARVIDQPSLRAGQEAQALPGWVGPVPPRGTCRLPPDGWWCAGDAGHAGPCPAWPGYIEPGDPAP